MAAQSVAEAGAVDMNVCKSPLSRLCAYTHTHIQYFCPVHSLLLVLVPLSPQLDTPLIISPQLLVCLLVYVIIYKLTLWNMNT